MSCIQTAPLWTAPKRMHPSARPTQRTLDSPYHRIKGELLIFGRLHSHNRRCDTLPRHQSKAAPFCRHEELLNVRLEVQERLATSQVHLAARKYGNVSKFHVSECVCAERSLRHRSAAPTDRRTLPLDLTTHSVP